MRGALLILVAAVLPACSQYSSPTITVDRGRVVDSTADGLVLEFELTADNSNEVALPLKEVRYSLEVEGRPVFSGYRSPEATVRKFGTQQVKLPAVIALSGPNAAPVAGLGAGSKPYRLTGTLVYTTPGEFEKVLFENDVRRPEVGFSGEGSVDFSAK